jgi:5-deoxy-D-glucuronate isomerase
MLLPVRVKTQSHVIYITNSTTDTVGAETPLLTVALCATPHSANATAAHSQQPSGRHQQQGHHQQQEHHQLLLPSLHKRCLLTLLVVARISSRAREVLSETVVHLQDGVARPLPTVPAGVKRDLELAIRQTKTSP